jgi:hypothetical protein
MAGMRSWMLIPWVLLMANGAQAQQPATPDASKAPALSVVEPKAPAKAKPAARKRAAKANAKATAAAKASTPSSAAKPAPIVARAEAPKPNAPCVIKPVMSDQDLVNCGATPRH